MQKGDSITDVILSYGCQNAGLALRKHLYDKEGISAVMEEFIEQIGEMILESVPALAVLTFMISVYMAATAFLRMVYEMEIVKRTWRKRTDRSGVRHKHLPWHMVYMPDILSR